jgi:methyltransferase (TIGR00027 family)
MEKNRRSLTAEGAAIQRALHQTLDDDPKILDDPIAPLLVDPTSETYRASLSRAEVTRSVRAPFRAVFVLRSRYAEDCLAESLSRGVRQYVLLGAGLDTFAYRQPAWASPLRVFEVDHPASQQWKRERLADVKVGLPANLTFVPVDFERVSLQQGLSAAAFDFGAATFLSWLGVTQYLTPEAIGQTLRFVLSLPRGSEIAFEFIVPGDLLPADEAAVFEALAARAADVGEPWLTRFRPDELRAKLLAMGFCEVIHLTPQEANDRYFRGRRDGLATWSAGQMMRAIV